MSIISHNRPSVKGIPFEDILDAFGHLNGLDDLLAEARILGNPRDVDTFHDRRAAMLGYTGD